MTTPTHPHTPPTFTALVVTRDESGEQHRVWQLLTQDDLPPGDVLVRVAYSSLNYKDGLAVTGRGAILRSFPMVPGIDLAGTVVQSDAPEFAPGDQVLLTGWGIGESHWGGYSQMARVRSEWLVPLPDGLSLENAMAIGTAGFTAMLAFMALQEHGIKPGSGDIAVTGASGGVGSFAVALLSQAGYRVVASTGRTERADELADLGAAEVIPRTELGQPPERPMLRERWAGAVDTVGGDTLASLIAATGRHGAIAACGLAGGHELLTTVFPFILRGISLLGIDSNTCPADRRQAAWTRLVEAAPPELLGRIARVEPLRDVFLLAEAILAGRVPGRIVLDVSHGAPEAAAPASDQPAP